MLWPLILKDLKLLFSDRRALIISLLVPIAIACFMTVIFGRMGQPTSEAKVKLLVALEDDSDKGAELLKNLIENPNLQVTRVKLPEAEKAVTSGDASVALVIPAGFGDQAATALLGHTKPKLTLLEDPSKSVEPQLVRGVIVQPLMKTILGVRGELKMPFDIEEKKLQAQQTDASATSAHIFAGMSMQGLLFFSIEAAMGVMRERRQGIWKRLRSAPVAPWLLLVARWLSGAMRAIVVLILIFAFGMAVFHFQVHGSWLGLVLVGLFTALMASAFGLFVAALGRNEQQSRGLSIFAVLFMLMLGGAWFPSFLMPEWVQKVATIVPVKWAIDGFDAMTWRGEGLASLPVALAMLAGFTALFGLIAVTRFRWDAEGA